MLTWLRDLCLYCLKYKYVKWSLLIKLKPRMCLRSLLVLLKTRMFRDLCLYCLKHKYVKWSLLIKLKPRMCLRSLLIKHVQLKTRILDLCLYSLKYECVRDLCLCWLKYECLRSWLNQGLDWLLEKECTANSRVSISWLYPLLSMQ